MLLLRAIIFMLLAAVPLVALSRRLKVPYPVLLALAGVAVALAPLHAAIRLEPDVVLAVFVAPVLLDAAFDTSVRDLKRYWRPVASLALLAVGLTTLAVALVAHALIPNLPWAAAVALGAIVAPPDAVSTMAVLDGLPVPHRLKVILGGEALLNDASTLLIYRLAVGAVAAGGTVGAAAVAPAFLGSILGSIVAGPALALVLGRLMRHVADVPSSIILQFVLTLGLWLLAEALGLSPILTLVLYAMTAARSSPYRTSARMRVPSYAVWDTVVLVMNVLVFLLIGLELGPVLHRTHDGALGQSFTVAAAVLGTCIAVRLLWTVGSALWTRRRMQRHHVGDDGDGTRPDWRSGVVVGWAGARGIVTVATALALPQNFPSRDMLLFVALGVTLGTLLLQAATLRPLVLWLKFQPDDLVDSEIRHARAETADAGLAALAGDHGPGAELLRTDLTAERDGARAAHDGEARLSSPKAAVLARVLTARRDRLVALRQEGRIGDDAYHRLEAELDMADLSTANRL